MQFHRNIKTKLDKALGRSPVVFLTGARQTGKTTLMKTIAQEKNYHYITFDDLNFLAAAKNDPLGFLKGLQKPLILDEIQRVPELFMVIKKEVDDERVPGQFILTGSANPLLIPRIGDSLAGRIEILELFPLSQGELDHKKELFIDRIFKGELPIAGEHIARHELYNRIAIGGYPLVQNLNDEDRYAWFNSYITTILYRDIKDLAQITASSEFPKLLQVLATRAGNLLNVSELSRIVNIPGTTLHRYIALLETIFLIYFQLPWSNNFAKRLVKSPKTYLVDTGLLCFLLSINAEKLKLNSHLVGNIFENFVVNELIKQSSWNDTVVKTYHFRTITGTEVDIILENSIGQLIGIEVKSSDTVIAQDFKGLISLQDALGDKFLKGFVIYMGDKVIPYSDTLFGIPVSALWQTELVNL